MRGSRLRPGGTRWVVWLIAVLVVSGCSPTRGIRATVEPSVEPSVASSVPPAAGSSMPSSSAIPSVEPPPAGVTETVVRELVDTAKAITALPDPIRPDLRSAEKDSAGDLAGGQGCYPQDDQVELHAPCVFGDIGADHHIVLVGDSHAAMWLGAFDAMGRRSHWAVHLLSKVSCPPPALSFYNFSRGGPYPECDQWHEYTLKRIREIKPDVVVLTGDTRFPKDADHNVISKEQWADGLTRTLDAIKDAGAVATIVSDIPRIGRPPFDTAAPECIAAHLDAIQECSSNAREVVATLYNDVEGSVAKASGARYIDVVPWFCTDVCTAVIGDMIVYRNASHITATYGLHLSGVLEAAIAESMPR